MVLSLPQGKGHGQGQAHFVVRLGTAILSRPFADGGMDVDRLNGGLGTTTLVTNRSLEGRVIVNLPLLLA